ncbi:hypothetical protein [Bradyrhizobium sp. 199]|uniref:hypothetical protein n=1 Tax=Bradyrhizobium sp. 199 TaxID=2782664 RepID=UPI001FFBDEA0|nr:hypothetical protein [Bradyrhizobium sp. 199]MCK1359993.1 hypothetical protein [Bradyrhizobium sp. 199]
MRSQISRQRKKILRFQRAGISTASAEALVTEVCLLSVDWLVPSKDGAAAVVR